MEKSLEKIIKIVCLWPEETWIVMEQLQNDNHTISWSEIYRSSQKGEKGYLNVKIWLNNNIQNNRKENKND